MSSDEDKAVNRQKVHFVSISGFKENIYQQILAAQSFFYPNTI